MIWFFGRDDQSLRLDTRYDNDTSELVVMLHHPDRRAQTERFTNPEACRTWLLALEHNLELQHWTRHGSPVFLPYGWPHRRPPP